MIEAWRTSDEREELGGGDGVKVTSPTATLSHFLVTFPSPALVLHITSMTRHVLDFLNIIVNTSTTPHSLQPTSNKFSDIFA